MKKEDLIEIYERLIKNYEDKVLNRNLGDYCRGFDEGSLSSYKSVLEDLKEMV